MRNMKRLGKEAAVNPVMAIIIVAIIVIAGVGIYVFLGMDAEDDPINAKVTIYLSNQENDEELYAEVNGNALSFGERLNMLAFGDNEVRTTEMEPLAYTETTRAMAKQSSYHVWADVEAKVVKTGSDIASCNYLRVNCIGFPAGYSGATWNWALTHGGENNVTRNQDAPVFGTVYSYDFADDSKAFDRIADLNKNVKQNIKGTNVDGMQIRCFIEAKFTATTGETFVVFKTIDIVIKVGSWLEDQVSISVTNVDVGVWAQ